MQGNRSTVVVYIFSVLVISCVLVYVVHSDEIKTNKVPTLIELLQNSKNNFILSSNKECDCGNHSYACELKDGKKVCHCDLFYAQDGDGCRPCNCGKYSVKCYFEEGIKKCKCDVDYSMAFNGECVPCDCGAGRHKCKFSSYTKICTCRPGFQEYQGKCENCTTCGDNSISCWFDDDGNKKCICADGYRATKSLLSDGEECTSIPTETSSWKIATYVQAVVLSVVIICLCVYYFKNFRQGAR